MRLVSGEATSFQHKNKIKGESMGHPAVKNETLPVTTTPQTKTEDKTTTVTPPASTTTPAAVPEVTAEEKMTFWNFLNDIQYGVFRPDALEKLNTWVIGGDGKWLVQKNEAGYFAVKKSEEGIPTLPNLGLAEAFIHLNYGRIPTTILDQIVAFFRGVMKKHSNSEAFCQVYWDKTEDKYIVHVPVQQVSGAAVRYDKTKDLDKTNPERYVFVYECHSHNNMAAFWSGTDNADESDLRVFGVFGKLGQEQWAHKHRTFVGEEELDLELDGVFDVTPEEPEYKVELSETESVRVKQSEIAVDQTPRFMIQVGENVVEVAKEAIKKIIKPAATFPEDWMGSVNIRQVSTQYQSRSHGGGLHHRSPQFSGSGTYSGSPYLPKFNTQTAQEGSEANEEGQIAMGLSEESGMEEAVETLCDYTNGFTDPGMTTGLMSIMEDKGVLHDFKNSILAYIGEFPDEDVTYVGEGDDMPYGSPEYYEQFGSRY